MCTEFTSSLFLYLGPFSPSQPPPSSSVCCRAQLCFCLWFKIALKIIIYHGSNVSERQETPHSKLKKLSKASCSDSHRKTQNGRQQMARPHQLSLRGPAWARCMFYCVFNVGALIDLEMYPIPFSNNYFQLLKHLKIIYEYG